MAETGKLSEYLNSLTAEPAADDLFDVSVLVSTMPDVYVSMQMRYAEIESMKGSGTLNTIAMFTPDGSSVGDSPFTVSSGDVTLLSGTLGVGVAADSTIPIYIDAAATVETGIWVDISSTTGFSSSGALARSRGVNAGDNIGGDFSARNSTAVNVGSRSQSGSVGISFDPDTDGFDEVGAVFQTASASTKKVTAFYSSINGAGTVDSYGGYIQLSNSSTGDLIGLYIDVDAATSGTQYIGQFLDGNEGVGKILTCKTADGKFQWDTAPSASAVFADNVFRIQDDGDATKELAFEVSTITTGTTRTITMPDGNVDLGLVGGWYGSQTRIKIAPWDVVSYNDKDGVSIQNNGGVVNDAAAKITTMVTGVFIPTGYRATAFMIYASANVAIELFESQIDDATEVSKGSGNANTEVNITNVDSTDTNYLSIIIVEAGNDIEGGYITIEKI